jgi:hypothetical protein
MQRPFPTDKPIRGSFTRKATISTRVTATTYLVDFGTPDGPTEIAFYSGFDLLNPGTQVICARMNETGSWRIVDIVVLV